MHSKITGDIDLRGKICLVTGASRGIGKGIAVQLALNGAKCYITGRKLETLEKIKQEVSEKRGAGACIPVQCDHSDDDQVSKLFEMIAKENNAQLDLLVNNAYAAVQYITDNIKKKFWEQPLDGWDTINNVGLRNHYRCSVHAAKLMVEKRQGLIINVSSPGGLRYFLSVPYGVGKAAKDRMARDCAHELEKYGVAYLSLWPGFVRTEYIEDMVNKTGGSGAFTKSVVEKGETPTFVGRSVAALLSEPHPQIMDKTGKIILTCDIARSHGITDEHGEFPPSILQINWILRGAGYKKLASYIPDFIRLPFWLITAGQALRITA